MKRKLIILTVLTCIGSHSFSQNEKHFSMFSGTKVQINPATSGFYKSKYLMQANYRNQWASVTDFPFRTYSASFNMRAYTDDFGKKTVAGGMFFYNDVVGDNRYVQTQIVVPVSYSIRLNEYNHLSFGLSPGFYQRNVRSTNYTWSSQWTGTYFDEEINSREGILGDRYSLSKFDVGAGLYWETELSEINYMGFGVSGTHLTKSKINFFEEDHRMYRGLNVHYFGNFGREGLNVTFMPDVMYFMQGTNKYLVFGSRFDVLVRGQSIHTGFYDRTSLEFGTHLRLNDALILSTKIHNGKFSAGFSYDIVVSSLNNFTGARGASEFYISYRFGQGARAGTIEIAPEE